METLDELRTEIRDAMEKRAEAEARHAFGDRIIDFATTNATVELPEVMVTNEIEIMRDELRTRLAQQRIGMDQYLALAKQTPEELLTELREPATRRVKTLLVLSAIAEKEGVDASDEDIEAEIAEQLARYDDDPKLREYLTSRRGRSYLRMTLRNRTLVDTLIGRALGTDTPTETAPTGEPTPSRIPPNQSPPSSPRSPNNRCSSRWSSSRAPAASARSTSTAACSRTESSSWVMRSRTTSPT